MLFVAFAGEYVAVGTETRRVVRLIKGRLV